LDFFGIYFVGTAPQTFEIIYYPGESKVVLNYITLGGAIEMYLIMRGTAQEIVKKYHAIIGFSAMPPFHALGFYQGSNNYTT
jgi:alpha-glucosidase (family GH31 glycosyl hydrolase)